MMVMFFQNDFPNVFFHEHTSNRTSSAMASSRDVTDLGAAPRGR